MSKEISTAQSKFLSVSKEIDKEISLVLASNVQGFQKAFVVSSAIQVLRENLTDEFMKPIMALQGSNLGFRTDKDIDQKTKKKGDGYPLEVVKDCLIDAVMLGLEATGNQFNIIGGNMYPTREGFGSLLDKMPNLKKNFTYRDIRQPANSKVANVVVQIDWQFCNEQPKKQTIDFPIKSNEWTSYDALIGKAERKAKRWLFNTIKGTDISDGDVNDIPHIEVVENSEEISNQKITFLKDLLSRVEEVITEEENNYAKRIINTKESTSYDKLEKFLKSKIVTNE